MNGMLKKMGNLALTC